MNSQVLVSVIMPVYNVESYLKNSVNSVINQTYKNLKIILVNDGSTDDSSKICESFSELDTRVTVIQQKNGGLSNARNAGTTAATGDYIFYLDSDDILVLNALELLVNAAEKYNADVVQGNFYYDYPNYLLLNKQQELEVKVYDSNEAMWALLEHKTVLNFAWGKLIKRELAQKHTFPEGKFYEDTFWKYKIIHDLEKYVALKEPFLYYLQRGSAISGAFSIRNLDQLEGELERLEFIQKHYPKNYERQALKLLRDKLAHHFRLLGTLEKEEQHKYRERLFAIENDLRLKKGSPKVLNALFNNINRVKKGIISRMGGAQDWQRLEKEKL